MARNGLLPKELLEEKEGTEDVKNAARVLAGTQK